MFGAHTSAVLVMVCTWAAPDVLGKLNGTSSLIQLRAAESLRIGSMGYELIEV